MITKFDYWKCTSLPSFWRYCSWSGRCSCFIQGLLIGLLLAGIILAIIIALWLTERKGIATTTIAISNLISTSKSRRLFCKFWSFVMFYRQFVIFCCDISDDDRTHYHCSNINSYDDDNYRCSDVLVW